MIYAISAVIVVAVTGFCFFQNRFYNLSAIKVLVMVMTMVIAAIIGMKILHYLEKGHFYGTSFFGSLFAVPLALRIIARPLKVNREILLDFSGPVFALFLAIVKLNCWRAGCCLGYPMYYIEENLFVCFPSAIVESFCGFVIFVILLLMQRKKENYGTICPAFLLIYGVCRFVLNFFRADLGTFRLLKWTGLPIPPGHLWSVVCVIWALTWLYRVRSRAFGRKLTIKEFTKIFFGLRPVLAIE